MDYEINPYFRFSSSLVSDGFTIACRVYDGDGVHRIRFFHGSYRLGLGEFNRLVSEIRDFLGSVEVSNLESFISNGIAASFHSGCVKVRL